MSRGHVTRSITLLIGSDAHDDRLIHGARAILPINVSFVTALLHGYRNLLYIDINGDTLTCNTLSCLKLMATLLSKPLVVGLFERLRLL